MKELKVLASVENLPQVLGFIDLELEAAGADMKSQFHIDLAVEEIFVNIANYAYLEEAGQASISIDVSGMPPVAEISFSDAGKPYNPLENADPDTKLGVEDREIGGLGIFLVKKNMDELFYRHEDNHNILTIKKRLQ
ncbi:MAG: ATP-binding protein [Eubacteriaceae bacterium]|jgi:anti-sigma regulatory factor (Ser/Thr protein kinase)